MAIHFTNKREIICGVIYRQHNCPDKFLNYFDETLERLSNSSKSIYVMTDANINLLRYETCKYAQSFLHILQSLCFSPTIDKPTRVHNASATLIDNIFVNNYDAHFLSGNIVSDVSDHFSQFCVCRPLGGKTKLQKIVTRDFSKFSEEKFINDLSQLNWESAASESTNDVNKSFSTFYNKLNRIVNKHAPIKTISKRKAKQLNKPWITKGLRVSIKKKNELFFSGDKSKYKIYRNKILTLSRLSKKLYYHDYFMTNSNDIKRTWEGINMLINRKRKNVSSITALKRPGNGGLSHHTSELPNILNNHFASVGPNLAAKIPQSQTHFSSYLPKSSTLGSFAFQPVTPSEVELEILSTPHNKAYGLFSCPTRMLKCASKVISKPLCKIINDSITSGVFPSRLKHAKVIPIYKNEDVTDPNNYRPISLLSVFNRIIEKLIYRQLKSFLEDRNMLYHSQYGFRERRSTEHALIDIVNQIQTNFDKGIYTCGIFIDLKKAFDTVDHSVLLQKLYHYGVRGIVNDWFCSYLSNRIQSTQIGPDISNKQPMFCGVPQGSVLGPLLFLLYVNDIYRSSAKLAFYLFADDTNLL